MRIDRIELYHVAMPLLRPWRTAYGDDFTVESVLCRMVSGDLEAWGESCPLASPTYSPEWAGGIFATAKRWFAPLLCGEEIESGNALQKRLAGFKGNPFAKALFDNTWWNLEAVRLGQPLHELLGASRSHVPVGADFGVCDSVDELLNEIGLAVEQQFPRVKLKYRPGWDLPMLREVRKTFPEIVMHIDCNSGYSLADVAMFRELDKLDLAMIEQPLGATDVVHHAELQSLIETPVCLDESIRHPHDVQLAVELGSCRFVNIKPGRVGGVTNALRIHDLCEGAGIRCWVGGMLESAIGVAQCAALAMLENCTYPADIFPTEKYYAADLANVPVELSSDQDGVPQIAAFSSPPIPDPERLRQQTVQQCEITAP